MVVLLKGRKTTSSTTYVDLLRWKNRIEGARLHFLLINPVANAAQTRYRIVVNGAKQIDDMQISTAEEWPFHGRGVKLLDNEEIVVQIRSADGTSITTEARASISTE